MGQTSGHLQYTCSSESSGSVVRVDIAVLPLPFGQKIPPQLKLVRDLLVFGGPESARREYIETFPQDRNVLLVLEELLSKLKSLTADDGKGHHDYRVQELFDLDTGPFVRFGLRLSA